MSNPLSVQDDFASTEEYSSTTINVLANDSGDGLTIIDAYVVADFASVTINENNTLTYYADIAGSDTIIYYVQDMFGNVTSGTLYMEILTPVIGGSNTAPMTQDDHAQTDEFSPLIVDVLSNDMDLDGDYFYVSNAVISSGTGGVFIDSDRTVLFTPSGVAGDVQITYTVVDDFGNYATGSLFITISPIGGWNTPPVANYDYAVTAVNTAITVDVLANDTDADGDILTLGQININPNMGSVAVNADGTVTFSPKQNFVGDVDIDYYITDSFNAESFSRLSVVVEGRLVGDINNNSLVGSSGNDIVLGLSGDDVLQGANGNDTLEGGVGNDYLIGGNGSDNYIFNIGDGHDIIDNYESDITDPPTTNNVDKIVFGTDITQDDIKINIDVYNLSNMIVSINGTTDSITILNYFNNQNSPLAEINFADGASWNQLALTDKLGLLMGEENDNTISGTESNNILMGLDGHDTLDGNDGDDVLIGGVGNDALQGDNGNDTYIFNLGDGQDTIYNFDSNEYYYGINSVDKLIFGTGINPQSITLNYSGLGDEDLVISINGSADKITLQSYFNTTLAYELDAIEFADGTIWNQSQISQMPVMIQGSAEDNILTGLHRNEVIKGLDSNDNLYGHDGDDVLIGGVGNDALQGDNGNDTYIFNLGDGQDTIYNFDSNEYYYGINSVDKLIFGTGINPENITLNYSGLGDEDLVISINGSADKITLQSYFNTTLAYELDAIEFADGTIWNQSQISQMPVMIQGSAEDNILTGLHRNEVIKGLDSNDNLYGHDGDDVLIGGVGNDALQGDNGNDTYIFNLGDGQDTIYNFDSNEYYYGINSVDKLFFGAGITASDVILLKAGNNTEDLMISIKKGTANSITLQSYFNSSLAYELDAIEFADGTIWDKAAITVLARANMRIEGTVGSDVLHGGVGDDTFVVNHARDIVMESFESGIDTVESSVSFSLGENLENLTLIGSANLSGTGNAMNNHIIGNSGNNRLLGGDGNDILYGLGSGDTLNGGAGADSMGGGAGNDTYSVENIDDLIVELADEGYDTINSFISYALNTNVERLNLEGVDNLDGTGNELDNVLNGNNANNHLIGGAGNDTLQGKGGADLLDGGLGSDLYYVDNVGDIVQELVGEGTDKVSSQISYTLTNNVEQLFLAGIAGLTGVGNILNNVIYGNDGNNLLFGDAGNDSLNGGLGNDILTGNAGNDTLVGGLGNDNYVFGIGDGRDLINNTDAGNGNDRVLFAVGIAADQLWLRQVGNDLEISIIGRADSIKVQNWYSDATKRVDSFELAEGNVLLASEVENLVAAMSAFTPPSMGQTSLSTAQHSALDGVIATNWESLTGTA